MAAKKEAPLLRGSKLIKKAIESAKSAGIVTEADPMPAGLAKKLKLPNGESISPAMKELFLFDTGWLGVEYDDEEAEIEGMAFEEIVEDVYGEDAVPAFAEANELFGDDCVFFGLESEPRACLYVGNADDSGEYPVLLFKFENGVAQVGGFVPFDVWAAQQLGALERGTTFGAVPEAYATFASALASSNGDGRVTFTPTAGDAGEDEDEDGDDDGEDADDDS